MTNHSEYFHTNDPATIAYIAAVCNTALEQGQAVRIDVSNRDLRIKRGSGVWSAPIGSDHDYNRDGEEN
jgi:hypothetical protein